MPTRYHQPKIHEPAYSFAGFYPTMTLAFSRLLFLFVILMFLGIQTGFGQSSHQDKLNEAESLYTIGQFFRVLDRIQQVNFEIYDEKKTSFEILAKNFIALDSLDIADDYIGNLLDMEPMYEPPANSPSTYHKRVENVKRARLSSAVSSVSKKMEDIFQAPATVIVMTQEEIRRRGYIDLDQMFDDLPGFDVSRTVGATTYSNLYQRGYRSNNTDRTIFMIDGIEDNDFWSNKSHWGRQIPISNVNRVEIIYGPASTMYGPNALIGVVNIITNQPSALVKDNHSFGISADAGYGTYNTKYGDLSLGLKLKKDVFFSVTGRYYQSDEMDFSGYKEFDYNPNGYLSADIGYHAKFGLIDIQSQPASIRDGILHDTTYFDLIGDNQYAIVRDSAMAKLDASALEQNLNGEPIGYSNFLEQYYILARLQAGGFTVGYQYWTTEMGNNNYGTDNAVPGYRNGGLGITSQSTLFARFNRNLSSKLVFSNTAQFRIDEIDANAIGLYNYSNGRLGLDELLNITESQGSSGSMITPVQPGWYAENLYERSRQFRNEMRLFYSPNRYFDVVGGLEYRYSNNQTDYLKTVDSTLTTYYKPVDVNDIAEEEQQIDVQNLGAYVQGTYSLADADDYEWLHLTLGGRYDYTRFGVDQDLFHEFSPRVAVVYTPSLKPDDANDDWSQKDHLYIKGIYARAFQMPTSWDRYATFGGRLVNNPDLKPEIVNNLELVVGYDIIKKMRVEISAYSAKYNNVVNQEEVNVCLNSAENRYEIIDGEQTYCSDESMPVSTTQNQNIDQLKIFGLQANFDYRLNDHWRFFANYSYVNPKDSIGRRVSDIASNHINAGGNLSLFEKKLNINLRMNYVGARPVGSPIEGSEGAVYTTVPRNPQLNDKGVNQFDPYFTLNGAVTLRLGEFIPGFSSLEGLQLQCVVNNILNAEYFHPGIRAANGVTNAYRFPQKGQNFMVRLIYDFN